MSHLYRNIICDETMCIEFYLTMRKIIQFAQKLVNFVTNIYKELQCQKRLGLTSNFIYHNSRSKFANVQSSHSINHTFSNQPTVQHTH